MIYIHRKESFCAAHKLWNNEWDATKNAEIFGSCSNANWHGHNYELHVTIKGTINKETGFLINLKDLSRIMKEKVIDKVDHKNFNLDVDFMKDKIASTEIIAIAIWEQLQDPIANLGATLHCVELIETEKNSVLYYGEQ